MVALSYTASFALLACLASPVAAQGCGGLRQPPCVDEDGNPFCTYVPPPDQGGRSAPNGNNVCVACGQMGRTPCLDEPVCNPGFTLGTSSAGFPACVSCGGPCPGECGGLRQPPCTDAQGDPFCTYVPPASQGDRSAPNGNGVCVACGQNGRPTCLTEPVCNPGFTAQENSLGDLVCAFCGANCPGAHASDQHCPLPWPMAAACLPLLVACVCCVWLVLAVRETVA